MNKKELYNSAQMVGNSLVVGGIATAFFAPVPIFNSLIVTVIGIYLILLACGNK